MRNLVRFNPTRAPQEKPIGGAPNIAHVASMVDGPLFAHLGHFAQPHILRAGHNTGGHPGFKAVQSRIAKREGVSRERAGAILAASSRRASVKAKRANPRLKRVKG